MNNRQFFDRVVVMRKAQKEYFRTRSRSALERSKREEKLIDDEIARVQAIIGVPPEPPPPRGLFD